MKPSSPAAAGSGSAAAVQSRAPSASRMVRARMVVVPPVSGLRAFIQLWAQKVSSPRRRAQTRRQRRRLERVLKQVSLAMPRATDLAALREEMVVRQLADRGIRDRRVLQAMREVPREEFVPAELVEFAYEDSPL